MQSFSVLLQQGSAHAWLFIPSAILLGALHGLEPGHSKTMMAAFIVAVRGTVKQAVLLGLAATVSHTAIVWTIALGGMYVWRGFAAEELEPYFQLASGVLIVLIALWMLWRTVQDRKVSSDHRHDHGHNETWVVNDGHGAVEVSIFEEGLPPKWRLKTLKGQRWAAQNVIVTTLRADGAQQLFTFVDKGTHLESVEAIPEPHEFGASLDFVHGRHAHTYDFDFKEHDHGHVNEKTFLALDLTGDEDAHQRVHANDIQRRFANRDVTTGQIILFGLTGGLIPCPAAITVLLLCLQLKQISLGFTLVLSFSIGLAVTLITVGAVAAMGMRSASKKWGWVSSLAGRTPYLSSGLIILVGIYMSITGLVNI